MQIMMKIKTIKIALICTDEALKVRLLNFLRGEKDILVSGFGVIQNVAHESDRDKGRDFMNKMIELQPDIIILDMTLLRTAAALYLPQLMEFKRKCDSMRAIIIGDHFYEQTIVAMMKGGVRGFLLRENLDANIIKCIHTIARGEIWLTGDLIGLVCDRLIRECDKKHLLQAPTNNQLAKMKTISRREMEVMALVSESMTNEEIAQKLFLSSKTVKTHIRNIFKKTGIHNRVEVALLYIRYKQSVES
jgi:two-component system, NarL family, response regulator DegU